MFFLPEAWRQDDFGHQWQREDFRARSRTGDSISIRARTADFLLCVRCGIYLAAVLSTEEGKTYATLNVNCLDRVDEMAQAAEPITYEGESASERIARRRTRWTPTEFTLGPKESIYLREGRSEDEAFLALMMFYAAHMDEEGKDVSAEAVINLPAAVQYVEGWGRAVDLAFLAVDS
jgi:hypothetical protein